MAAPPARPKPKPAARPVAAPPRAATGFDWGNGSTGHSISLAAHKKHLADNAANKNPLYDPTEQLSGADLRNAAGDLTNLEFGPQRAALQRELDNTTTQGTALAGRASAYSSELADRDAALVPKMGDVGVELMNRLAGNQTDAAGDVNQALEASRQRAAADAAVRGGVGGDLQTAGAGSEAQQQLNRLAEQGQQSKDAAAAQTASYQQLAGLSAQARAQMGQEIQGQLLNRLANNQGEVRARQTDLSAQEGASRTKNTLDLRQQGFENLITQEGLNIKTADIKAQTALGQAKIKAEKRALDLKLKEQGKTRRQRAAIAKANREQTAKLDREARRAKTAEAANKINDVGISNADWLKMSTAQRQAAILDFTKRKTAATTRPGQKPKAKPESATAVTRKGNVESMVTDITTDKKLAPHRFESGPRLVQILVGRGADPLEAQAAAEIARHGAITPATEAKLRSLGVRIPKRWRGTTVKSPPRGNLGG